MNEDLKQPNPLKFVPSVTTDNTSEMSDNTHGMAKDLFEVFNCDCGARGVEREQHLTYCAVVLRKKVADLEAIIEAMFELSEKYCLEVRREMSLRHEYEADEHHCEEVDALKKEIQALREALESFAHPFNWEEYRGSLAPHFYWKGKEREPWRLAEAALKSSGGEGK